MANRTTKVVVELNYKEVDDNSVKEQEEVVMADLKKSLQETVNKAGMTIYRIEIKSSNVDNRLLFKF